MFFSLLWPNLVPCDLFSNLFKIYLQITNRHSSRDMNAEQERCSFGPHDTYILAEL